MGVWTKKKIASLLTPDPSHHQMKRELGSLNLVLLGVGVVVGAGLFSLTGIGAAENAGPAIVFSFLLGALGCCFAGLSYCELAAMIPVSGSAYSYAYASMGQLVAWVIGWTMVLEYAIGASSVSISWSSYVISLCHQVHIYPPPEILASYWQPTELSDGTLLYGYINLPALLIVVLISLLLMIGVKQSSMVINWLVFIKLSIISLFVTIGFFYIRKENYDPFIPPNTGEFGAFGVSGIFRGAATVFFAYVGFDAVSTASQEAKNPQKTVPIGIIGALILCTIIYTLFSLVMTGLVNYRELDVPDSVAVAINQIPFLSLYFIVNIGVIAGLTSVILGLMYGQSRIFYKMAEDKLLPKAFYDLHPVWKTPWRCNIILMIVVALLGAFAPITALAHMTSIGTLLSFVIVCIAVIVLRYRHPEIERPFKTPFFPITPIAGIIVCSILMCSLDLESWIRLIAWTILGLMIYFLYGFHRARLE